MADQLNRVELLRLARLGAASRLAEIRQEIASLEMLVRETPGTRTKGRATPRKAATAAPVQKKSAWSAAKRRAVSLRMKKYWAARRQAKNDETSQLAEQLNRVELLRLARLGATSRLEELRREIVSLETLLGGDAPREKSRATAAEDREGCAGSEGCTGRSGGGGACRRRKRRGRRPRGEPSACG